MSAGGDAGGGAAVRVLIVEDNETNQLVLKTLLELAGMKTELAPDGQAGVEAWEGGGFELIMMDVQMPVLDGVSAARRIRAIEAERGLARTPIVACTANIMPEQVAGYLAAGMDDCVAKPLQAPVLYATIERVMSASAPAGTARGGRASVG